MKQGKVINMAWIQIDTDVMEHDKIYNLADTLKVPNSHAVGLMVCLWTWVARNAVDGDITNFPIRAIANGAGWKKKPELFFEAISSPSSLFVEHLDDKLQVRNWEERAAFFIAYAESRKFEEQKSKSTPRVQKYRDNLKANQDNNVTSSSEQIESDVSCNANETECNVSCNTNETLETGVNKSILNNITLQDNTTAAAAAVSCNANETEDSVSCNASETHETPAATVASIVSCNANETHETPAAAVASTVSCNANETHETPAAAVASVDEIPFKKIMDMYHTTCTRLNPIKDIGEKRKRALTARYKDLGIEGFQELFDIANASDFICGGGEKGWKADFDWLIHPDNITKVLEGKYDNGNRSNVPGVVVMPNANRTPRRNRFANFKGRERDYNKLKQLERELLIKGVEGVEGVEGLEKAEGQQ